MTVRLFIILVLAVSLLGGCGTRQEKALPPPPIKVVAIAVEEGDLRQSLQVSGNLQLSCYQIPLVITGTNEGRSSISTGVIPK